MRQFRITIFSTETESNVLTFTEAQERWANILDVAEDRGWRCLLEVREILSDIDDEYLDGLRRDGHLPVGYLRLGNRLICPWTYDAGFNLDRADICNRY